MTGRCPACGAWPDPFTGAAARLAAAEGRLEQWVHRWLTGAGRNVPMFHGLRKIRRWWLGPVAVPVGELTRIVGPEPGMAYPRGEQDWAPRLDGIAESIRAGWDVPPVIAQWTAGGLVVSDGNHRCEAQRRMGRAEVACIVWFDGEDDWRAFQAPWAAGAAREAGAPR